jgi:hypothetical protein
MKTIVWDVDDVLNTLLATWLETAWRPTHPSCTVTCAQLTENPPQRLLGITAAEYRQSLDEFRLNRFGQLHPVAEIVAWFETHGGNFRHIALTATPLHTAPGSAAWVMRHFGRWIRTFAVVPSPRPDDLGPAYDRSKADYLRWWGQADILVDDHPAHVIAAQKLGLTGLLVVQPWNQNGLTTSQLLAFLNEGAA